MRALTVIPRKPGSFTLEDVPDPVPADGDLLVDALAVGICGTDREIVAGEYGWAPPGRDKLVIGHESLGRVRQAPPGSAFAPGDLVAGVVRRPDPVPCGACARGQFDMCRNGGYTERGIKQLDGYAGTAWTVEPEYAVKLDPGLGLRGVLLEPASVLVKAWEQVDAIGHRAYFDPRRVLVTGAGPIGLLAAMLGTQRGLEAHVLDRVDSGPKPDLVSELGGRYHRGDLASVMAEVSPDVIIEATGASQVVMTAMACSPPYGIVCLTGVSPAGRHLTIDAGQLNTEIVLENDAIVGSVNANLGHYRAAADALAKADAGWLDRMITRRVPLEDYAEAFTRHDDDVKVVVTLEEYGRPPG